VPGLSAEGGADYQNHPSLGSENMIKVLHLTATLLALAFGSIFILLWQIVVCVLSKKPVEEAIRLTKGGGADFANSQSLVSKN